MFSSRLRRGLGGALAGLGLLAAAAPAARAASEHMVSGRIAGLPSGPGVSVTVEAVTVRTDAVAASGGVTGDTYAVRVPLGPTLLMVNAVDIRHHRQLVGFTAIDVTRSERGVTLRVRVAPAADRARAATAGASVSVSTIPISGPDGQLPGGAEAGLISGMLPVCRAHGGKLFDGSNAFKGARKVEQQLADQGQLDFKLGPWEQPVSDFGVNGSVRVGPNGGPLADIDFLGRDGHVVHFLVSGDPEDWDNIGAFMARLGDHILQNAVDEEMACDQASEPPPPPKNHLRCHAEKGEACVTFVASAQGSLQTPRSNQRASSYAVDWDLQWLTEDEGYGQSEPSQLEHGSSAGGSGSVTYAPGTEPNRCDTEFSLTPAFPPTLDQNEVQHDEEM